MENQRLVLFAALGVLLLLLWSAWQRDYHQPPQATQPAVTEQQAAPAPGAGVAPTGESGVPATGEAPVATDQLVRVQTDVLDVTISLLGGDIRSVRLLDYTVAADDPTPYAVLDVRPDLVYVAQTGLLAKDAPAPGPQALFQADASSYSLADDQDQLTVTLRWTADDGIEVEKRYVFHRNRYLIDLQQQVTNHSEQPWQGWQFVQLRRTAPAKSGGLLFAAQSYTGGVLHSPEQRYQKISFGDIADKPLQRDIQNGWLAMLQHYFVAAWVPPREATFRYYTHADSGQYVLGASSPWQTAQAGGGQAQFSAQLYVGPKDQDRLAAVAPDLELTVDYGKLTIISKPLFWLLKTIHSFVGNWGWSIVLLTLLIKVVFYKLSETSYRSMARMRTMQPKMQALKERYGDDRQKLNQELMELYKREKINPLGGCLPILIQIPVFIALYWVLLESVELRQAEWILWYTDLSVRDPYYVLPILMGVSMLIQQRLNPSPLDPIQQRVMMAMPIVFTVFFLFFPAGLVLYWVVNGGLGLLQQWYMLRKYADAPARA